jgi:putative redox protein
MPQCNTQVVVQHNGALKCPRANAQAPGYNGISNTSYASWGTAWNAK